jgi:hypothetical protein
LKDIFDHTIEKLYWVWKNRFNSSKIFYFILTGAVFVLVSLLVVMIAGSGLIQIHTRILDKILPVDQLSCPDDDSSDEEDSTCCEMWFVRFVDIYGIVDQHNLNEL